MDSQDNFTPARGKLFIVATPIGNLADMTYRAVKTLQQVDWIAAEDTRNSRTLLQHYEIQTPMFACHEHNEAHVLTQIQKRLDQGESGALISDAGTPLINDPGYRLVRQLRQSGYDVEPLPGACSPIVALCASGLATDQFTYMGFLARSGKARRQQLQAIAAASHTCVFLESPRRLLKTLKDMLVDMPQREVCVARELTKLHESFVYAVLPEVVAHFDQHPPRGEIVVMVGGASGTVELTEVQLLSHIQSMNDGSLSPSALARAVAQKLGLKRSVVYDVLMQKKQNDAP